MTTRQILPIIVVTSGLGLLTFAIINSGKKKVTYSTAGTNSNVTLYGETFNAKEIAKKLKEAMLPDTFWGGTDENEIIEVLTGITQAQFYKVIIAFGMQPYNPTKGSQFLAIYDYSLPFWLKNELDDSDYKLLKTLFPKHLK